MSVESIEIQNVKNHFSELINAWCESNSKTRKIKPELMCQEAIKVFGDSFSPDFIRKNIDSKFKVKYRQKNARVGILKRLGIFENSLNEKLYQTKVYEAKKK